MCVYIYIMWRYSDIRNSHWAVQLLDFWTIILILASCNYEPFALSLAMWHYHALIIHFLLDYLQYICHLPLIMQLHHVPCLYKPPSEINFIRTFISSFLSSLRWKRYTIICGSIKKKNPLFFFPLSLVTDLSNTK